MNNLHNNLFLESLLLGKFNYNLETKLSLVNANFLFCISGIHIIGFLKLFRKLHNLKYVA